eukprot:3152415-Amphidinium_carterae.1
MECFQFNGTASLCGCSFLVSALHLCAAQRMWTIGGLASGETIDVSHVQISYSCLRSSRSDHTCKLDCIAPRPQAIKCDHQNERTQEQ